MLELVLNTFFFNLVSSHLESLGNDRILYDTTVRFVEDLHDADLHSNLCSILCYCSVVSALGRKPYEDLSAHKQTIVSIRKELKANPDFYEVILNKATVYLNQI